MVLKTCLFVYVHVCSRSMGKADGRAHLSAETPSTLQPASTGRHNGCLHGGKQSSSCPRAASV